MGSGEMALPGSKRRIPTKESEMDTERTRARDEWVEKAKTKLDEWNEELDELEAKARVAKAEQKARYQRLLAELREYRDKARHRVAEVEEKSDAAWDELKEGAVRGWNALQKGFQAAVDEFKKGGEGSSEGPSAPPPPPA